MPFPRPSFNDLIDSALSDLARLQGSDVTLRRSVLQVLAMQAAALASGEYDYLDWMVVNVLLPDTATGVYLDRWANIMLLQREGPALSAGNVIFTGQPNIPIPAGTQAQTSNGGLTVTTTAAGTVAPGQTTVSIPAVAGPGSIANLAAGAPLNLLLGIAGILGNAVVDGAGFTGGTDSETDTALRVRVLAAFGQPPQGGAAYDYVSWAKLVPGVTRVWVYRQQFGAGTLGVAFVMDGRTNIIPLSADVAAVQASISTFCPETATPSAYALTAALVNINIHGLTVLAGYTLAAVQANIALQLAALFSTTTPGGLGWDGNAGAFLTGGALDLNAIYGAIDSAAGVGNYDLTAPAADQTASLGVIFQLGAITYV